MPAIGEDVARQELGSSSHFGNYSEGTSCKLLGTWLMIDHFISGALLVQRSL